MVRKNLLDGLMDVPAAPASTPGSARPEARAARPVGGAIGAVNRSITELRARAVIELDPALIAAGGLVDRLEHDAEDHAKLIASIREYGQQVPVLVRPHPAPDSVREGQYQIVYGRRRVLACRDLGQPVKAMVRELDDRDLILAQGQENSARRDLSFIEKANFARQMVEAGLTRKIVCDALSIDKTAISRMLVVVDRVPEAVIRAIGPAPSIGRARWMKLADLLETSGTDSDRASALATGARSDDRFEALLTALAPVSEKGAKHCTPLPEGAGKGAMLTTAGALIGRVHHGPEHVVVTLEQGNGFAQWLTHALPELYCAWTERNDQGAARMLERCLPEGTPGKTG